MADYSSVTVTAGSGGWGGPLTITPSEKKPYIASVTGGGIHPVAQQIADLTGGEPFDAFRGGIKFEQMACVIIDCGGTARVGVYPMKGVLTIDVHGTKPAGPLARQIKETNFVSGVGVDNVTQA